MLAAFGPYLYYPHGTKDSFVTSVVGANRQDIGVFHVISVTFYFCQSLVYILEWVNVMLLIGGNMAELEIKYFDCNECGWVT